MAGQGLRFESTALMGTSKSGILKPDKDGYFTMPIGALNAFNSAGEYYTLRGAEELFKQDSTLMRRVADGALHGEVGHPSPLGLTDREYVVRIHSILESNLCVHFSELWLDTDLWKKTSGMSDKSVAIMAKLIPSGAKKHVVADAMKNGKQNLGFSVRGLTDNHNAGGITQRALTKILTFDYVYQTGMSLATKYNAPALESRMELPVDKLLMEEAFGYGKDHVEVATESAMLSMGDTLDIFNKKPVKQCPIWEDWK